MIKLFYLMMAVLGLCLSYDAAKPPKCSEIETMAIGHVLPPSDGSYNSNGCSWIKFRTKKGEEIIGTGSDFFGGRDSLVDLYQPGENVVVCYGNDDPENFLIMLPWEFSMYYFIVSILLILYAIKPPKIIANK